MAEKGNGSVKKRGPEFPIRLPSAPTRLRRDTPFICNIKFKNDLPEIPCDPKMLLPPLNPQELAAFSLTSLEKDMKRDMLFEPDLGIPISMLDIERYTIPYASAGDKPPLHPDDAELLKDEEGEGAGSMQRARLRGSAAELSWLLRTKYITNEGAEQARKAQARELARKVAEEEAMAEGHEGAIAAIERSFEAAQQVPVHPSNPALEPVEVLPVFPDELLEGRIYVLALFDNDPSADLTRLQKAGEEERQQLLQSSHLKSFARQRADGKTDKFVAYLVPQKLRQVAQQADAGGGVPAEALQTDYEWVREYDQQVKYDAKDQTFLFRFAADHVGYHDLNTKLLLRKRKRQQFEGEAEDFVPPEKVVLRLPGNADLEEVEEDVPPTAAGSAELEEHPNGQQAQKPGAVVGDVLGVGGGVDPGLEARETLQAAEQVPDVFKDVFGDDDDDF